MQNEDLLWLGLATLGFYFLTTTPTVEYPKFLLEDLKKSKVIIEQREEVKLPELNIIIKPIKPKPGAKYYPWSPDSEILIDITNIGKDPVELYVYLDLAVKYPQGYAIVEEAISTIFPFLRFTVIGYNYLITNLIKSILGKDYITIRLNPNETKTIRVVFPFPKLSIPLPFVYVEHDLIIKVRDKFGRSIIREVKYYVGYP